MKTERILIVPPLYLATILNAYAVEISARKLHLLDESGKRTIGIYRKNRHESMIKNEDFHALVLTIRAEQN